MAKSIPLTRGLSAVVDDEDYADLAKFKWYAEPRRHTFYAARTLPRPAKGTIRMHTAVAGTVGFPEVDHIDGDGLNNVRSNLRPASTSQNQHNQRFVWGASAFRGVSLRRATGKWRAQICKDGRSTMLGDFALEVDAAHAYDEAAIRLFGDFAGVNFPR